MTTSTLPRELAPAFSGPGSHGASVSLDDYRGRYLVLFFFPASFTYGCTRETARFRDLASELDALGAAVVGVSPDTLQTQRDFATHYQVQFPIVSDPERTIAKAFQALFPIVSRVKRITYVIDPESYIVSRFHHELRYERHADAAVAFLKKVAPTAQRGSTD